MKKLLLVISISLLVLFVCTACVNPLCKHDYECTIIETATCENEGEKSYVCKNCDYSYTEKYTLSIHSADEIYEMAKDCAVEIITYDRNGNSLSLGSGFVYTSNGQIVTNYHVIEEACSADVYVGDTKYSVVSVLAYDIDRDIAILKINASDLQTLTVCDAEVKTGSVVYALGSSRGLTSTFSNGIVTQNSRTLDGVTYIQHNAAISNGNSGGPLINEYGEIIGINTLTIRESQNLNFAIFVSELDNLVFNESMTLEEVYNKECNAFLKLVNYIKANNDYDEDSYRRTLGTSTSKEGKIYFRSAYYYPEDNKISIAVLYDGDAYLSIDIVENASKYRYGILYDDYYMFGYIYLSTFNSDTGYLSYDSTNLYSYSMKQSLSSIGASLSKILILSLYEDLESINVTAVDLGFINF